MDQRPSDVDLGAGIISVERTLDDGERGHPGEVVQTKTRRASAWSRSCSCCARS